MRANRGRSASFRRRWIGVAAASSLLLMAPAPTAGAGLKQNLDQAKARLAELKGQIEAQQAVLDRLSAEAAAIAMQIDEHQGIYEQVTAQLQQTQVELEAANRRFQAVLGRLNERLREAFMQAPAGEREGALAPLRWRTCPTGWSSWTRWPSPIPTSPTRSRT